jgi:sRNA-binding carbon storage regulator CsrA
VAGVRRIRRHSGIPASLTPQIDGGISITGVAVKGDRVRIGVTSPKDSTVDRLEVHERRSEFVSNLQEFSVQP